MIYKHGDNMQLKIPHQKNQSKGVTFLSLDGTM